MKKIGLFAVIIVVIGKLYAQPVATDTSFPTYYHQRAGLFQHLPANYQETLFIGNSITDGGEWGELFKDNNIKNRGISGDITTGLLYRLKDITSRKPKQVFIMIGINDLARGIRSSTISENIIKMVKQLKKETPDTKIFVQSILPVNGNFGRFNGHTSKGQQIVEVNGILKRLEKDQGYTYVDLYTHFCNASQQLDSRYTNDGLHLKGEGYLLWKTLVYPYVYSFQDKPAIIPSPEQLKWTADLFPLYACRQLFVKDGALEKEVKLLQELFTGIGYPVSMVNTVDTTEPYIEIVAAKPVKPNLHPDQYTLTVTTKKITIQASGNTGIYYGIQTLKQLMRDHTHVPGCVIKDEPAFPFRGFMIDVGRNYMSLPLLKKQIEVMAAYKMNVFHFHATEDIAWRLESKKYPQLHAPDNMLRNKGMFYTVEEIRELISFCKERYIEFIPEIDMPGHSAAFRRAMKTDMQTDSGLLIVKNLLNEFCDTYDVNYVHIGADEVKITNPAFIPEVTRLLEGRGKKIIGWEPGGNFNSSVIRQLWMDDLARVSADTQIAVIDSRHLYINHMDPLESVVTIFNRMISGQVKANRQSLGGVLCLWHDKNVRKEEDVLMMNPVYPGLLAFAERIWAGGGKQKWVANITDGDVEGFARFEEKLMEHRQLYFKTLPFPYQQQSSLTWNIAGPYENEGNVHRVFAPEPGYTGTPVTGEKDSITALGGTIVIRHWWAPLIKGAVDAAKENQTWYATTRIWSDTTTERKYWIGFNNISRSPATDSPPLGAWDHKGSKIWVNEKEIPAPRWARAGQKGHAEIPLIDEGYEYREPHLIQLQKGWNKVLLKLPMNGLKGKDWQNPQKWMFTFVPVQ